MLCIRVQQWLNADRMLIFWANYSSNVIGISLIFTGIMYSFKSCTNGVHIIQL